MKNLLFISLIIPFMLLSLGAGAQAVTVEIDDFDVVIGDTSEVPIYGTNFLNVASMSLSIGFDTNLVTFIDYGNGNPAMGFGTFIVGANKGDVRIAWFSLFPGSFAAGNVVSLFFEGRAEGVSSLTFDTIISGNCEITGSNGVPMNDDYTSGSIYAYPAPLGFKGKVVLQGAYNAQTGSMNNAVGALTDFPLMQPFGGAPWNYSGTEQIDSTYPANVVDWVMIEVRDSADAATVVERRAALLLTDGSIVDTNFVDEILLQSVGNYYVALRHKNHFAVMTANAMTIPDTTTYNFCDTANFPAYANGTSSVIAINDSTAAVIAGDINQDGKLKYSGSQNDKSLILQKIVTVSGSNSLTTSITGYYNEDVNINGVVKYSGSKNDPSLILQNLVILTGSTSLTSVYLSPVPAAIIP